MTVTAIRISRKPGPAVDGFQRGAVVIGGSAVGSAGHGGHSPEPGFGLLATSAVGDIRVAQQLGLLAGPPPLAIMAVITLNVIKPSAGLALGLAAALFAVDGSDGRP